jgi:hypothetical protein
MSSAKPDGIIFHPLLEEQLVVALPKERADCADWLFSRTSLNGGFGWQLRHDSSWIRLEIEASGRRSTSRRSISPIRQQAGHM